MKKILMFGTREARYHSSIGVDDRLRQILPEAELTYSEDRQLLSEESLARFDLVISYFEFTREPFTDEETAALLRYVAQGGGLLGIHSGITFQYRPELLQLLGGKFTHHPPYDALPVLTYQLVPGCTHPIVEGLPAFTMGDEAYMFQLDDFDGKEILLQYDFEGETYPAAWAKTYGKGRVFYTGCCHNLHGFENETCAEMLRRAAFWAADQRG